MLHSFLVSATLFALSLSLPASNLVLHEKRDEPHMGPRKRVERDSIIPVRIALRQTNLHTGYDRLIDVSDPDSPNYGRHLSSAEVHDIFAPSEDTIRTVKDWLLNSGIQEDEVLHYTNKGWLAVDMPAHHAEKLFATEYYEHELSDSIRVGCDSYHLPAHVSEHVDFLRPGVVLSLPLKKRHLEHGEANIFARWLNPSRDQPHTRRRLDSPQQSQHVSPDLRACGGNMTPPCIKALYQIPQAKYSDPANVMGELQGYSAFVQKDLNLFFDKYAPNVPEGTSPKVDSVDGGIAPTAECESCGEADIDIEMAYSIVYPQDVTVYQVADPPNSDLSNTDFINTFLEAVDGSYCNYSHSGIHEYSPIDHDHSDLKTGRYKDQPQCGIYPLTKVLSISYGRSELVASKRYEERHCFEFMKLGLQRHSLFVASGDFGVADYPYPEHVYPGHGCLNTPGLEGKVYNPGWPNVCPFITSVGGTQLEPGQTVHDPESAMQLNMTAWQIQTGNPYASLSWQFWASGGGFSNYFPQPKYQASAVSSYLANHNEHPYYIANKNASNIGENGGIYNRGGRGFPDVSANGAYIPVFTNGAEEIQFGSSLSAPIFASVINLINEERLVAGKGPVGFVNPVLYANPHVLNDITKGSNPNCGSSGFQTAIGWDPVTGLGTPNYPKMLDLFMSLP